jgi:arabinogalactan endo-1,4-beta-galactosidase
MPKRTCLLLFAATLWGCANSQGTDTGEGGASATGGATASGGGNGTGGSGTGGSGSGGTASGTGGAGTGGSATGTGGAVGTGGVTGTGGGAAGAKGTGGATATGGATGTGGAAGAKGTGGTTGTGGAAGAKGTGGTTGTGGAAGAKGTGGSATGGTTGTGGSGTSTLPSYFFGADVTDQEPAGTTAINNLLTSMKANGFNFVRLRTFVDPKASDGYDKSGGYDDVTHTVAFGKLVKDAGMGLLVDFHMSDNWADPGKQCMPVAWQGYTNITDLSTALHDYVKSAITALIAGGARPDMVQIGNETTPGMLLHICDSGGQPTGTAPKVTGAASTAGWPNLGMLLKAGVQGVKDVDTGILISFHIDRGNAYSTSKNWLDNAIKQGATPDTFGESCYQQYQGDVNSQTNTQNGWQTTFSQLATNYPNIRFFAAEYGPMERQINDVVFGLPNNQGLGTFDWEPTSQGSWNNKQPSDPATTTTHALWSRSGSNYTALPDLALYPPMKTAYASRL